MSYLEDPFEGTRLTALGLPIEPLRQDNYREWALGMTMLLRQRALAEFIVDPAPQLASTADAATSTRFNARQDAALATIYLGVSKTLRSMLVGIEKPHEAWEKLRNAFEPTSRAHIAALKTEFSKLRLQPEETMGMFCSRVDNAAFRLENVGKKMDDTDIAYHLIQDLPDEYDSLVSAIYLWDDEHFTSKQVKTALCAEYGRLQERGKMDSQSIPASSSFNADVPTRAFNRVEQPISTRKVAASREVTCFRCQRKGHISRECPEPKPVAVPKTSPSSQNTQGRGRFRGRRRFVRTRTTPTINLAQSTGQQYAGFYVAAYLEDASYNISPVVKFTLDTAATHHIVNDPALLTNIRELPNGQVRFGVNVSKATAIGKVEASSTLKGQHRIYLKNVLCVPSLDRNLLSWRALDAEGCTATLGNGIVIISSASGTQIARAELSESFYQLDLEITKEHAKSCPPLVNQTQSFASSKPTCDENSMLWHDRLGHANFRCLKQTQQLVTGMDIVMDPEQPCESCTYAKSTRNVHHRIGRVTTRTPLELVHSDLWGPAPVASFGGSRYFVTFIDDFSRLIMVYQIAKKNEVYKCFIHYRALAERQTGFTLQRLRTDNGLEYCAGYFTAQLSKLGIIHEHTNPYSPQMNGVAERANRTLLEAVRAMLINAKLPPEAWAEMVSTAAYLRNRTVHTTTGKIPLTEWIGKIPSLRHLRRIGCVVWVHLKSHYRNKLQPRAIFGILLGYAVQTKGYRVWIPKDHKMIETMHLTFAENERGTDRMRKKNGWKQGETEWVIEEKVNSEPLILAPNVDGLEQTRLSPPPSPKAVEPLVSLPETRPISTKETVAPRGWRKEVVTRTKGDRKDVYFYPPEGKPRLRSAHEVRQYYEQRDVPFDPEEFDWSSGTVSATQHRTAEVKEDAKAQIAGASAYHSEIIIPSTYREAQQSKQCVHWYQAIKDELETMETREVWQEVTRPSTTRAIGTKWVFAAKKNAEGEVKRFRARLVAQGQYQREGLDYGETYSPVIDFQLVRVFVLLLVISYGWCHAQLDIKSAYLYGPLKDEEIYLRFPLGYTRKSSETTHLLLSKALYGLHQSGRIWNEELDIQMKRRGFVSFKSTKCIYVFKDYGIVLVYVDDLAIFAKTQEHLEEIIQSLESAFDIKRLGPISTFLGVDFEFGSEGVKLSQQNYIEECTRRFDIPLTSKPVIPLAQGNLPVSTEQVNQNEDTFPYRELLGCLLFLSQRTRPDIAVSCCILGQFTQKPKRQHWEALVKLMAYCNRTKSLGLAYAPTTQKQEHRLCIYVDADWGSNSVDRHSISGYLVFISGQLIAWRSVKQKCVALSTMEAEFLAISEAAKHVIWINRILEECQVLGIHLGKPRIYCDSKAAIDYSKNTMQNARSRHIDIRYHFVKELIQSELFELVHVPAPLNLADILTKPLARQRFEELREGIMPNQRHDKSSGL